MEQDAAQNMARSLADEANVADRLGTEATDRASSYFAETLSSLPDAVDWAVFTAEYGKSQGVIVAEGRLYVVDAEVGEPPDPAEPGLPLIRSITTSWSYDSSEWTVRLESVAAIDLTGGASGFRTFWTFSYAGRKLVEVRDGEVHLNPKPGVNRAEAFARSLAKKVDFRIN